MKGLVNIRGIYHINIHYKGEHRRRSSHTGHKDTAVGIAKLMQGRRQELLSGLVALPPGVDPWAYIFEGVKEAPAVQPAEAPAGIDAFQAEYAASLGPPKISAAFAKTQRLQLVHFTRFREKHPDLPAAVKDWRTEHIEKYRLWRPSPKGANDKGKMARVATMDKEIGVIRRMFEQARKQKLIEQNPVRDLEHIPDDPPDATWRTIDEILALERTGHLNEEEIRELRSRMLLNVEEVAELKALLWGGACKHYMKRPGDVALFMNIAGDAGLRNGEIRCLTTLDIDLNVEKGEGVITARSQKQSKRIRVTERHVPISGSLVRRLAGWMKGLTGRRLFHECSPAVFRAELDRRLDAATAGTKFVGVRPHQLRHALRTNMFEAGVDEITIDAYLGHTTKEMGKRYRHIRAKRLAEAAQAYAQASARAAATADDMAGDTAAPA